jgi:hypothetical protein
LKFKLTKIDCSIEPLKMPKLKELKFSVKDEVIGVINSLFTGVKLTRLSLILTRNEIHSKTASDLADFLSTQETLLELRLSEGLANKLFDEDQPNHWYNLMKLRTFSIHGNGSRHSKEVVAQFLSHQKTSLKTLKLGRVIFIRELLENILQLNLDSLEMTLCYFQDTRSINVVNKSIKKLCFYLRTGNNFNDLQICNMMKACSVLNEIDFQNLEITSEMSLTMFLT